MGYLQKAPIQSNAKYLCTLSAECRSSLQERERIERKGRPVVESAVGRVFAELATVPVRLDKQPGG